MFGYVNGFQHLFVGGCLAQEKLGVSQSKMKTLYDNVEQDEFSPGEQVLALMPLVYSLFQARYADLYTIIEKIFDLNCVVTKPRRRLAKRLFHVNILKPYYRCVVEIDSGQGDMGAALAVASEVFSA